MPQVLQAGRAIGDEHADDGGQHERDRDRRAIDKCCDDGVVNHRRTDMKTAPVRLRRDPRRQMGEWPRLHGRHSEASVGVPGMALKQTGAAALGTHVAESVKSWRLQPVPHARFNFTLEFICTPTVTGMSRVDHDLCHEILKRN
jgi:hypothetical protein